MKNKIKHVLEFIGNFLNKANFNSHKEQNTTIINNYYINNGNISVNIINSNNNCNSEMIYNSKK